MNIFIATGNLGKDCTVNQVGSSTVCNFTVAAKAGYGDKQQTIWLDCALWGKRAEGKLPDYLVKGQQVVVSGELGNREHEGKTYLTLRVENVDLSGGKQESGSAPTPAAKPQPAPAPTPDGFDDDIPF